MITLYGIKNCDTVKKARKWFDEKEIDYQFHDFRQDGLQASQVESWMTHLDWQTLVNKRSTTWRNLDDDTKNDLSADNVVSLLVENPTLIKRPVLEKSGTALLVGFNQQQYNEQISE